MGIETHLLGDDERQRNWRDFAQRMLLIFPLSPALVEALTSFVGELDNSSPVYWFIMK